MTYQIIPSDIIKWASEYGGPKFHGVLCDPPYHLTSIVKRFGKADIEDDTKTSDKVRRGVDDYSRLIRTGFMGQTWDGGDVAFQPETWKMISECLLPGAHLLAFGGTRTWHRLAVAIEDAGFKIRDTIAWVYGSGFPKSHNLHGKLDGYGSALKPAFEPIILARKPLDGTMIHNCTTYGCGALNIDNCRIPGEGVPINKLEEWSGFGEKIKPDYVQEMNNKGRWPANLIHDGSEEVIDLFPISDSSRANGNPNEPTRGYDLHPTNFAWGEGQSTHDHRDKGSAARFFYCAKATKSERNAGCQDLQETEQPHNRNDRCAICGGYILQTPDRPSACHCEKPERIHDKSKNNHPTVKPIALTEYLARLILPPAEYAPRRLLVPFSGSGSEMIGGYLAGWDEITGVELSPEYCKIATARLKYWTSKPRQVSFELEE